MDAYNMKHMFETCIVCKDDRRHMLDIYDPLVVCTECYSRNRKLFDVNISPFEQEIIVHYYVNGETINNERMQNILSKHYGDISKSIWYERLDMSLQCKCGKYLKYKKIKNNVIMCDDCYSQP